jgi:hypothetical protein
MPLFLTESRRMAKKNDVPILKVRKGATVREIYARAGRIHRCRFAEVYGP